MLNGFILRLKEKAWTIWGLPDPSGSTEEKKNSYSVGNRDASVWVSKETLIVHAWESSAMAPDIFSDFHLPNCNQCAVRYDESLEEAAHAYQIPLNIWLISLNFHLRTGPLP